MKATLFLLLLLGIPLLEAEVKPLRVGMELSYPPFEMVCPKGTPCGVSVDLADALGIYLQRPVRIDNTPFIGLIPSLNTDKVDLVISSLTVTPQRQKVIDFSIPYASTSLGLLLNINSKIENIEQLNKKGKIIAVKAGTTGEVYAANQLHSATIRVFDREAICVLEVIQGKADAFIYDQLSVYTNWKKNPGKLNAILTPFYKEEWAIGIKKGNDELRNQVDAFIEKFRKDGGFDRLSDKFLSEQKADFKKLNIPFVF